MRSIVARRMLGRNLLREVPALVRGHIAMSITALGLTGAYSEIWTIRRVPHPETFYGFCSEWI